MIKVYIENVSDINVSNYMVGNIRRAAKKVAELEKPQLKLECSIMLCDNEYIREFNSKYRKVDSATDVLSFPIFDFDTPEVIAQLGDIIISVEKAQEQAQEYGHSLKRELAFLTVHGMLHLFGYDHIDPCDRDIMEKKQREILNEMGITR